MRPTRTSGRLGGRRIEGANGVVERVPLDRNSPRAADEREQIVEGESLRRVRAGLVIDLLAHHRPLEVVDAPGERDLRKEGRDHDPVRLDVVEIVEEQTADRDVAKIIEARRRGTLTSERDAKLVVIGVIRERDVCEEAARLVL